MQITINDRQEIINGETIRVSSLLAAKNISAGGTAVAINGKLCRNDKWDVTDISDGDNVTIITAAFGG